MSSLFIIGNGFDIAHGIPTRYSDFREFIINKYPDALEFRDEVTFIEEIGHVDIEDFAAEILLSTMDKISGEDWQNFEEALAYIDFDHKFPLPKHNENQTEDEYNAYMTKYILYIDRLSSGYIGCSKLWQDIFQCWLKEVQTNIDKGLYCKKDNLQSLFSASDAYYFTFNYTKTLQRLYNVKKVTHIHNRVGQKLIFGHGQERVSYGSHQNKNERHAITGSSFFDDMLTSFKKDTSSPLKKYSDCFKKLNHEIDRIYSYGFSCSKVDSVYIKEIINRVSPKATWYFTSFEAKDKEAIRIKKIRLRRYGFKGAFGEYN